MDECCDKSWRSGHTRKCKIVNECIKEKIGRASIEENHRIASETGWMCEENQ